MESDQPRGLKIRGSYPGKVSYSSDLHNVHTASWSYTVDSDGCLPGCKAAGAQGSTLTSS